MNVSKKGFIKLFSSRQNEITMRINSQTLNDDEYFTPKCYSDVLKNSNRIFAHGYLIYYHI
jgi:hypothetical protein